MFIRRGLTALLIVCALITASACRTRTVLNVQDHPIPAATQRLPLAQIGQTIIEAGRQHHWRMDPAGPGQITGIDDGAMPDILSWITDRFAGRSAPSTCNP